MDIIQRNFFNLLRADVLGEEPQVEPMSKYKWERLRQLRETHGVNAIAPKTTVEQHFPLQKLQKRIHEHERHAIDTSVETLELLDLIVDNVCILLDRGVSLRDMMAIGRFLRSRGDKVDFVKLDTWLYQLRIRRMAGFIGSVLVTVFNFDKDEIPFIDEVDEDAPNYVVQLLHTSTTAKKDNKRRPRFFRYGPTISTLYFFGSIARDIAEIEE